MGHGLFASIAGIPAFLLYGVTGLALLAICGVVFVRLTPHNEIEQIRAGNVAAALGFGGNLVGFALPLSRSIQQASSIPDLAIWAGMALLVQLLVFHAVRYLILPDLSERLERGEVSAGVTLGAAAVAGGLVNAASMTL